ncbi:hypothetical protein [Yoonia sediminilitoris]|uniref:Phage ABA sandwich domain-containing protein n=1 Tax=Yoonia sediminilitoris TaxID=1286148 RepID=A0A2T6KEQ8_9RHOB|nr:hypothetical protein [Yoonia sediminilitoris]PUB13608.1 hypothetical protein C8N45_10768 [Yoonia sediminilitoris]RCW94778.1 hypothetical protein DFP92_10768 [Yoonia sediminilitoris]
MKDPELDILIEELEKRTDLTVADFDGVSHGLGFLLPELAETNLLDAAHIGTSDSAMHIADKAFPNWAVHIHGRANDKNGHWRCTLRESDSRDNDAVIGRGRSPVLGQAILAATMRLAMSLKKD